MTVTSSTTILQADGSHQHIEEDRPMICTGGAKCMAWTIRDGQPVQVEHLVHWDPEKRHYETYCCGTWWVHSYDRYQPGEYCHYGAHYIHPVMAKKQEERSGNGSYLTWLLRNR
jgi:hypothetical protein